MAATRWQTPSSRTAIVEQGVQGGQALVACPHVVVAPGLQVAEEAEDPLEGEVLDGEPGELGATVVGHETQQEPHGVAVAVQPVAAGGTGRLRRAELVALRRSGPDAQLEAVTGQVCDRSLLDEDHTWRGIGSLISVPIGTRRGVATAASVVQQSNQGVSRLPR